MKKKYSKNNRSRQTFPPKHSLSKISYTYAATTSQEIHSVASKVFGTSYYITYKDLISVV